MTTYRDFRRQVEARTLRPPSTRQVGTRAQSRHGADDEDDSDEDLDTRDVNINDDDDEQKVDYLFKSVKVQRLNGILEEKNIV